VNRTLTNILYSFIAVVIAKCFGITQTFFLAKILEPSDYGVWISMLLIISYAPIANFGTIEALLKQFPYFTGKGKLARAKEIEDCVLGSTVLSTILILIIGFTFHFVIKSQSVESLLPLLRVMFVTSALSLLSAYSYYRFPARHNFKIVSIIDTTRAFLSFFLVVSFSWFWGLQGTVLGLLITEVVICVFSGTLSINICGKLGINIDLKTIKNLIWIGFPISLIWWIYIVQTSADRLISIWMLGSKATGYYGLGVALVSIVILLPRSVSRVLYPRVNEKIGETISQQELRGLVIEPAQVLSLLLPLMIGTLILLSPIIYHQLLPKYSHGLVSAQILLAGSFFICLVRIGGNFVIAIDKQSSLLKYFVISLIVNILGNIAFVKLGYNIEGIAISTSFSAALLTSLVWKSVFKNMGYTKIDQWKGILDLYLPFLLSLGLIGFFILFVPDFLVKTGLLSLLHVIIFVTLFLAIVLFIAPFNKRATKIYHLIKVNMRSKSHALIH